MVTDGFGSEVALTVTVVFCGAAGSAPSGCGAAAAGGSAASVPDGADCRAAARVAPASRQVSASSATVARPPNILGLMNVVSLSAFILRPSSLVLRPSSFVLLSVHVRRFPRAHTLTRLVEEPLVVADSKLPAGFGRELRKQRRIHVVDLEILRLLGRRDLVAAEQESIRMAVD